MIKISFAILSLLTVSLIFSQPNYSIASIKDLPFKQDSFQTFQNKFSQLKDIGSIKNSNSEMEIRYYQNPLYGRSSNFIYQFKYVKGNFEENVYSNDDNLKPKFEPVELIGSLNGRDFFRKKINSETKLDSFMYAICRLGLFYLQDQKNLIDSLKNENIEIYHYDHNKADVFRTHAPGGYDFFEVKIGDKYRNFRIAQQTDGYYLFNKELKIFKTYYDLTNLINSIIRSSRISN